MFVLINIFQFVTFLNLYYVAVFSIVCLKAIHYDDLFLSLLQFSSCVLLIVLQYFSVCCI